MLRKGLVQGEARPALRGLPGHVGEQRGVEGVARQRTGQVFEPALQPGLQCGGTRHLVLDDQLCELRRCDVQPVGRNDTAGLEWVGRRVA